MAYPLSNPIERFLDKPREEFNRTDLIRLIESRDIERITFHYTALDGKLKELKIPVSGRNQAEEVLANGERVDGSSLFKGLVNVGVSDLYVVPVYKTVFLNPFDPGSLDFVCRYFTADGEYAPFSMDNILAKAAEFLNDSTGLELYAMGELEFLLLSQPSGHLYQTPKQKGYHESAPFVKSGPVIDEMVHHIAQITGAVKYAHSEVGHVEEVPSDFPEISGREAEQLEMEFLPSKVLDAGDHLLLARWLIRNIAYRHNRVASFAPKLEEGMAGNGMHVHMELRKDGQNVMTDRQGRLTELSRKLIGGLCHHADSLTAFGNTVAASYFRLVPDQEAPTKICWSDLNRSAMIRVPLGWSKSGDLGAAANPAQGRTKGDAMAAKQTVELRTPDGSALPYLLLAGIAMAVEWGINSDSSHEIAKDLYVEGNIFENSELMQRLANLPESCVSSANVLIQKRARYERGDVFPKAMIDYIAGLLETEDDGGLSKRLSELSPDNRVKEMSRIMHSVLHAR